MAHTQHFQKGSWETCTAAMTFPYLRTKGTVVVTTREGPVWTFDPSNSRGGSKQVHTMYFTRQEGRETNKKCIESDWLPEGRREVEGKKGC